jgi:hypothetical protein
MRALTIALAGLVRPALAKWLNLKRVKKVMLNASESIETARIFEFVHFDHRIFPCSMSVARVSEKWHFGV